ncbi:MAG: hypothetical protein PHC80_05095 [Eubacteriales bacterium]|nr:hypothetical protein [Eubacteriales bacterium]
MNAFRWLLLVARRDQSEAYIDFLTRNGAGTVFGSLCQGAAKEKTLDLLGLEAKEKILLSTLVSRQSARTLMRRAVSEMRIDAPNSGIALTVNVDGISGTSALHYLCGDRLIQEGEVNEMKDHPYSLIIAISDKGQSELVLEASRSAGASGGTLIYAKEIGANPGMKFFGVSIAEEKEHIYLVVPASKRNDVLRAIIDKAGVDSPAHTVAFSLPVDQTAGLSIPIQEEE